MKLLTVFLMSIFMVACSQGDGSNSTGDTTVAASKKEKSGVCEPLQEKGITGGLYGLCNAYQEAIQGPADPSELDGVIDEIKNGGAGSLPPKMVAAKRILDNYEKKRKETDPRMPGLQYGDGTCPVVSVEEMEEFEDYALNGGWVAYFGSNIYDQVTAFAFAGPVRALNVNARTDGSFTADYRQYGWTTPQIQRTAVISEAEYNDCLSLILDKLDQYNVPLVSGSRTNF